MKFAPLGRAENMNPSATGRAPGRLQKGMTMSDQNQSQGKGYNITLTPKGQIDTTPTASGTKKIKFRATFTAQGKEKERTVVAQGKSAEAIEGMITAGEPVALRVLFDRAPANDEGKQGGEYLTVLGLPLPPKAKAA